jgi:hypothetical protein
MTPTQNINTEMMNIFTDDRKNIRSISKKHDNIPRHSLCFLLSVCFFSLPGLISGPPAVPQHLQLAENHHCLASQIPSVIKVGGLREISKNLEKMGINGPF